MSGEEIPVSPREIIRQRTDEERLAYTQGFEAGARMVFKGLADGRSLAECEAFFDSMMYLLRGGRPA